MAWYMAMHVHMAMIGSTNAGRQRDMMPLGDTEPRKQSNGYRFTNTRRGCVLALPHSASSMRSGGN